MSAWLVRCSRGVCCSCSAVVFPPLLLPPAPVLVVLLPCLARLPPCHCCRFPLAVAIFPHKLQHRGAKLEATDGDQYTPLLIAARWNRIDMVKVRAGLFWLGSSVLQGLCW